MTNFDIVTVMEFIQHVDVETAAEKLLVFLGFQTRLVGTRYLSKAITMKYNDEKLSCGSIYADIAEKQHSAPASVERAIRHALNNCRREGNIHQFNLIVGFHVIDRKFYTTNSEFISVVSKWLRWVRTDNSTDDARTPS